MTEVRVEVPVAASGAPTQEWIIQLLGKKGIYHRELEAASGYEILNVNK